VFHDKANGIASLSATKSLVYFFGRGNGKRWGLFIVKWTISYVIGASSF
jgi:hypothetical protein